MDAMARPRNQAARRDQLIAAAGRVLLKRGSSAARLSDIAGEAGVTSAAVLYYYRDVDDLFTEVFEQGVAEYVGRRQARVAIESDPTMKLRACIHSGVPWPGISEAASRVLVELQPVFLRNESAARQQQAFVSNQIGLYQSILQEGAEADIFNLLEPAKFLARNLVALEDGFVVDVLLGQMTADEEHDILVRYAKRMVQAKDWT